LSALHLSRGIDWLRLEQGQLPVADGHRRDTISEMRGAQQSDDHVMAGLTRLVQSHVVRLFPLEERQQVMRLLLQDCGGALPFMSNASPAAIERVQCAALKLSEGRIDKLYDAIALAQTDWRDLLVSAGFAEDTQAHKAWKG
jgi:hypothetical protein